MPATYLPATYLIAIIINAMGLGSGLLGLAVILLQARVEGLPNHRKALIGLIAILTVDTASSIFDMSPLARDLPQFGAVGYAFWPWIPVCLWAYINGLTRPDPDGPLAGKRHVATAGIATLCFLPFLLLSGGDKLTIADGTFAPTTAWHIVALLGLVVSILVWIGHMLVVAARIARRLAAHRRAMRNLFSETSAVDLRWLDGFMLFLAAAIGTAVADNTLSTFVGFELLGPVGAALTEALIIFGLCLFGFGQPRAIPQWASEAEEPLPEPGVATTEPRYARSSLSGEDCAEIIARLDAMMQRDEPWRDPFLNLKTLSERIATKPYYVTQALNTVLGRNFYDYVNGWRVRAAAHLLTTSDLSVIIISEEAGFNSKSTFNAVFRKEMDTTPSAYRLAGRAKTLA